MIITVFVKRGGGGVKGEITHSIESVPKVSHLWGKMDFFENWT